MTVAVVTSATGVDYHHFLPEWAGCVAALTRTPDEVVIATDGPPDVIVATVERLIPGVRWVPVERIADTHYAHLVNAAIATTSAEWIAKVDVDDRLLPGALDGLEGCTADVYGFGYRINGGDVYAQPVTAADILRRGDNPLSSCSPFRRWLWKRHPFRDMTFDDWAFWLEAAAAGATFAASPAIDYEYRQHPNQATRRNDAAQAIADIHRLRATLEDA